MNKLYMPHYILWHYPYSTYPVSLVKARFRLTMTSVQSTGANCNKIISCLSNVSNCF